MNAALLLPNTKSYTFSDIGVMYKLSYPLYLPTKKSQFPVKCQGSGQASLVLGVQLTALTVQLTDGSCTEETNTKTLHRSPILSLGAGYSPAQQNTLPCSSPVSEFLGLICA